MMKRGFIFILFGLFIGTISAKSQEGTPKQNTTTQQTSPDQATVKPHIDPELDDATKEVVDLYIHGLYSNVISRCSAHIGNIQDSDARLLYFRGVSAWRIGLFDRADKDLSALGDFKPYQSWPPATQYTTKLEKMKTILPPKTYEVRNGDEVVFRVFYTTDDEWASGIVKLLPTAYRINHQFLKRKIPETQVFIFQNSDDFHTFYSLRGDGHSPGSWAWAAGDTGMMFFCENLAKANSQSSDINSSYFLTTMVHEFNHTVVLDIIGGAPMPRWFKEGLAMVFQIQASAENALSIKQGMQRATSVNGFLPLSEISSDEKFTANTEQTLSKNRQHISWADPYAQSCFMASYFVSQLPEGGLESFLTDLQYQRKFDEVFEQHTQLTPDEFYKQWLAQLSDQLG